MTHPSEEASSANVAARTPSVGGDDQPQTVPVREKRLWAPLSPGLIAVCLLAAALHLVPFIAANQVTPPGWTFTGNTNLSPDYMQYRIWMRQSQKTGMLVSNTFTGERNPPHLPVVSYWAFGKIAKATGARPEMVYELAGCVFAFALTWLVWSTVAHFGRSRREKLWAFAAIMLAGGLASHMRLMDSKLAWFSRTPITSRTISYALDTQPFLESFRGTYVLSTLFDTHFLLIWTVVLVSTLMAYQTLRRPTPLRWGATLFLFAFTTLIHIYEGAVLIAIIAGTCLVLRMKGLPSRAALILLVTGSAVVAVVAVWQIWLWRSAGLPLPVWGEKNILLTVALAGYPLALALIVWGGADFVRRADLADSFLIGWAAGLLAMILSGPFFPYPTRGTVTLSIPLAIIAARIYFHNRARVPLSHATIAVLLLFALPVYAGDNLVRSLRFEPTKTHIWVNNHHLHVIDYLKRHASSDDLLVTDRTQPGWKTDDRWLAPEYPGRLYCGHFFLTVDYENKRRQVINFYRNVDADQRAAFLREAGIRWIFAGPDNDLDRLRATPGIVVRVTFPEGALLEFVGGAG